MSLSLVLSGSEHYASLIPIRVLIQLSSTPLPYNTMPWLGGNHLPTMSLTLIYKGICGYLRVERPYRQTNIRLHSMSMWQIVSEVEETVEVITPIPLLKVNSSLVLLSNHYKKVFFFIKCKN